MTPLEERLASRINRTGPISIAEYMAECLFHPEFGYYTNATPFGASGDFVTAPEISQLFGEMVGLCLAQHWLEEGSPSKFILAELGPGRGTFMSDILRAMSLVPGITGAADIFLIEASPKLRDVQKETLKDVDVRWIEQTGELQDDIPLYIVGNEFFDALPVRQFVRHDNGWAERMVGLESGNLTFGLSPPAPIEALDHRLGDTKVGDIVEICPQAVTVMNEIEQRISKVGGVGLFFDYGDWRSLGDTLQAVRRHEYADVLADPGKSDLTAHVDFEALAAAAPDLYALPLVTQGVFLERLGITARAQNLAKTVSGDALDKLVAQHRRLTHPDEMGRLFKVLGFVRKGAKPPVGFSGNDS